MFRTRPRLLAATAGGLLLLAPLSGCGGGSTASETAAGATASSTPSDSNAAASALSSTSDGSQVDVTEFINAVTTAMKNKKTAHMVMDLGSSLQATADIRYTDTGADMSMKMSLGGQTATMLLVDDAVYLQQGTSDKYIKLDKSDPSMGAVLGQIKNLGPEAMVKTMQTSIKKVVRVGEETVDGQKLVRYRVTVDPAGVGAALGVAGASSQDLPKRLTYDFYVDGESLMRKLDMTVSGQHIVMTISGWGEPVDITAPPASEVMAP